VASNGTESLKPPIESLGGLASLPPIACSDGLVHDSSDVVRAGVGDVDNPGDKQRCRDSVLDARERTVSARDSLKVELGAVGPLLAMEKACMDYLNFDERDEVAYARGLVAVKGQLLAHEQQLATIVSGLVVRPWSARLECTLVAASAEESPT
jgi:hypothetical protein